MAPSVKKVSDPWYNMYRRKQIVDSWGSAKVLFSYRLRHKHTFTNGRFNEKNVFSAYLHNEPLICNE